MRLENRTIAILATDGFEQSELLEPLRQLREAGAVVHVVSPKKGSIRGWNKGDWGESVEVDVDLESANADDYDALVLPGGQMNPDTLRADPHAVQFVRTFYDANKPLAAICHAPWLLIEADIVAGMRATSYGSIRKDMINASANWVDEAVVVDKGVVTSRDPDDLDAFCEAVIAEVGRRRTSDLAAAGAGQKRQ